MGLLQAIFGQPSTDEQGRVQPKHGLGLLLANLSDAAASAYEQEPTYRTALDNQAIADALEKSNNDPSKTAAAIARVNPKLAPAIMQGMGMMNYRNASLDARTRKNDAATTIKYLPYISGLAGSVLEDPTDSLRMDSTREHINGIIDKGYDIPPPPEGSNPDEWKQYAAGLINYKDQLTLKQRDRSLDQGDVRLKQGQQKINETGRHNQTTEGISQQNANSNARGVAVRESVAPSQVRANNSKADFYGDSSSAPNIPPPSDGGQPPYPASEHPGKVAHGPTGSWKSNGKTWIKIQ